MDKKIIKGLIDEKLEVIQEQFSIIRGYEGKIPIIELDLIMTSIRDLYELILSLQIENMGGIALKPEPRRDAPPDVAPLPATVIEENPVDEIYEPVKEVVLSDVFNPPASETVESVRLSPGIISMEPVPEEKPVEVPAPEEKPEPYIPEPPAAAYISPEQEPPAPAPVPEPEHDHDLPHEKYQRITIDLFSDAGGSTVADRLRDAQEKRIADKLQENKVVDLRTTIGINDKFLFINELFDGNMRIYDEAIQKFNACNTMAQADLLLLDLKIAYNWDSESPTVKKFVELVRRKF
jgi:hypothetical protein